MTFFKRFQNTQRDNAKPFRYAGPACSSNTPSACLAKTVRATSAASVKCWLVVRGVTIERTPQSVSAARSDVPMQRSRLPCFHHKRRCALRLRSSFLIRESSVGRPVAKIEFRRFHLASRVVHVFGIAPIVRQMFVIKHGSDFFPHGEAPP